MIQQPVKQPVKQPIKQPAKQPLLKPEQRQKKIEELNKQELMEKVNIDKENQSSKDEPEIIADDLAIESIGGSTVDRNQNNKFDASMNSMVPGSDTLSKTNKSSLKILNNSISQNSLMKGKNIPNQSLMGNKTMSSTYNTMIPNNQMVENQPQKIVISKDAAEQARKDREAQREKVLSEKPEIYYIAQAELRYQLLLSFTQIYYREQQLKEKLFKEKIEREKIKQEQEAIK